MIINGTVGRICKVWGVFQVFLGHVRIYVRSTAYVLESGENQIGHLQECMTVLASVMVTLYVELVVPSPAKHPQIAHLFCQPLPRASFNDMICL